MTHATSSPRIHSTALTGQPLARHLCPYCGHLQSAAVECEQCRGLFEPLSRQATQNSMGPWQVRDTTKPFAPAFSYDTLKLMVARGRITSVSIIRGPTTNQFWRFAVDVPGVGVLLGRCHLCRASVATDEYMCRVCGAVLTPTVDRQHLGLAPVQPLSEAGTPTATEWSSAALPLSAPRIAALGLTETAPVAPLAQKMMTVAQTLDIPPARSLAATGALRRQNAALRSLLLIAAAACMLLSIALLYAVMVARSPAAPATPPAAITTPTVTPPSPPPARTAEPPPLADTTVGTPTADSAPPSSPPSEVPGLDTGLASWGKDIDDAAKLADKDTKESLRQAIDALERVRTAATESLARKPEVFPLLSTRIELYRARLDKLLLRDLF